MYEFIEYTNVRTNSHVASHLIYLPHAMRFFIKFEEKKTTILFKNQHLIFFYILSNFHLPLKLITLLNDVGLCHKSYTLSDVMLSSKTPTLFE